MRASATLLNVRGDGGDSGIATLAGLTAPDAPDATPATAPLTSAMFGASAGAEGPATVSGVLERGGRERRALWVERLTAVAAAVAVAEEGEAVEEVEEDLDREGR